MKFKNIVLSATAIFALASNAQAAKLEVIQNTTDTGLNQFYQASVDGANTVDFFYTTAVKIKAHTPSKGRTDQAVRQATVAQAAHTLCGFFDDGVTVSQVSSTPDAVKSAVTYMLGDMAGSDDDYGKLANNLTDTLSKIADDTFEIYSGDAGGNNTSGTILGVYDLKNDEIVVMSDTNCGSDN